MAVKCGMDFLFWPNGNILERIQQYKIRLIFSEIESKNERLFLANPQKCFNLTYTNPVALKNILEPYRAKGSATWWRVCEKITQISRITLLETLLCEFAMTVSRETGICRVESQIALTRYTLIGSITSTAVCIHRLWSRKSELPTTSDLKPYLSWFGSSHHSRARNNCSTCAPELQTRIIMNRIKLACPKLPAGSG